MIKSTVKVVFTSCLYFSVFDSGISDPSPDPVCEDCPASIVENVSKNQFLKFVLLNCVQSGYSVNGSLNILGKTPLGGSDCLATWVSQYGPTTDLVPDGSIPQAGDCRDAYQTFADDIQTVANLQGLCVYESDTDLLTINQACVGLISAAMDRFAQFSQLSIAYPQCTEAMVRSESMNNRFAILLTKAGNGNTNVGIGTGFDGLCYQCYTAFLDNLNDQFGSATDSKAACATDYTLPECYLSGPVQDAIEKFKNCSGKIDVAFQGSLCTSDQIDQIQHLIPSPFFTLTECAYNNDSYCAAVTSYLANIGYQSTTSCGQCYSNYLTDAIASLKGKSACSTAGGVVDEAKPSIIWSDECIAALAGPLFSFRTCAGFSMETTMPTVDVVPVNVEIYSINVSFPGGMIVSDTGSGVDGSSSTISAADNSTKSSSGSVSSGMLMATIACVVLSILV